MEQPLYTALKVNNEIELCEISDLECKQLIERQLLKERISYFIRWVKPSIFRRKKNLCIIWVNDMLWKPPRMWSAPSVTKRGILSDS